MRITVHAKTQQKAQSVTQLVPGDDSALAVRVHEPPTDNQANIAIIKLLAEYFHVPKQAIRLNSGSTSKTKVFEID